MNRQNGLDNITIHSYNRNILAREMISNVLMHREFTSPYMAKFVIEKERMYVENANRATGDGFITPDNLEPNPKNPIIASFFRNIGLADTLGSGTRKLFKYSKYYSGRNPEFKEGDVFRIIVPLNDEYSFDYNLESSLSANTGRNNSEKMPVSRENTPENDGKAPVTDKKVPLTKKYRQYRPRKCQKKMPVKRFRKKHWNNMLLF